MNFNPFTRSVNPIQPKPSPLGRYSGLELRHLRLIWAMAEENGLSRAAARLRLTPSALSHQLRALERISGGPVVRRKGKRLQLTHAGELLLETATRVLSAVGDAEDRLTRIRAGTVGTVRLSTHCFSGYHWLPAVMVSFRQQFPDVDVRIVAEATTRAVSALKAGEIDLAITPENPTDQGLLVRPVLRDEMVLVMAPTHPLSRRSWVEPEEIAREHLLAYSSPADQSALCQVVLRPLGLAPAKTTTVRLTEAIIEMARAGIGVAALAEWAVQPYAESGRIATKRITRKGWSRTWNAITWPEREAGAHVMAFVDQVSAHFGANKKVSRLEHAETQRR